MAEAYLIAIILKVISQRKFYLKIALRIAEHCYTVVQFFDCVYTTRLGVYTLNEQPVEGIIMLHLQYLLIPLFRNFIILYSGV